ncbi:hypothetical protein AAWM_11065 [Aspergillus awamori]|uniref:Uncharacterized protein n=1 Tax=Aspergillus awamori TaxID=105351 RepID=A0A401L9M2_ASPAW|nr:uncharacterized protein BO96DRAFT_412703 [Aspergillus niger CBS 101883]KAI2822695.1 hypothetical protein CBS133816_9259 [Aspergillus niger]GCB28180.1 hypothetical protein AAWM_11065 [Aspergillus awamori]KAI2892248.1 hypothetical protein CBS11852_5864 [Aspergillus niger]PYH56072.1 hypothetical protein BO96DRAFT_412703 [Aspergillus niger CBS 101883]GJP89001.1 short chain dehydrogenase family protein [Aspergillus niger]
MEFIPHLDIYGIYEILAHRAGIEARAEDVYAELQALKQIVEDRIARSNAMAVTAASAAHRYKAVKLMYLMVEAWGFEMEQWFYSMTAEGRGNQDALIDYARRFSDSERSPDIYGRMQLVRNANNDYIEGLRHGEVQYILASYQEHLAKTLAFFHTYESEIESVGLEEWWGHHLERGVTVNWDLNRQVLQEARGQQYAPVYSSSDVVSAGNSDLERAVEYVDWATYELEAYVMQTHGVQSYAAIEY